MTIQPDTETAARREWTGRVVTGVSAMPILAQVVLSTRVVSSNQLYG